jgi:hypothetical protein
MKKTIFILSIMMLGLIAINCTKDPANPPTPYNIRITDAPGPYSAVYIDLQGVEITGNDVKLYY